MDNACCWYTPDLSVLDQSLLALLVDQFVRPISQQFEGPEPDCNNSFRRHSLNQQASARLAESFQFLSEVCWYIVPVFNTRRTKKDRVEAGTPV